MESFLAHPTKMELRGHGNEREILRSWTSAPGIISQSQSRENSLLWLVLLSNEGWTHQPGSKGWLHIVTALLANQNLPALQVQKCPWIFVQNNLFPCPDKTPEFPLLSTQSRGHPSLWMCVLDCNPILCLLPNNNSYQKFMLVFLFDFKKKKQNLLLNGGFAVGILE